MAAFVVTVILWVTEALPLAVTAVGAALFLVLTGAADAKTSFASLGDPVIFLFIGSFMLARAMETTGLAKRAAYWLIRQKWATSSIHGMLLAVGLIACLLSLFISNTATTAMLLPIVKTVLDGLGKLKRDGPESSALLLMTTWAAGIAVGTVVATPPNMIGISILREQGGVAISFTQFAMFGLPVTLVLILLAWFMLGR